MKRKQYLKYVLISELKAIFIVIDDTSKTVIGPKIFKNYYQQGQQEYVLPCNHNRGPSDFVSSC